MKNILNTNELLSLDENLAPIKRKTTTHIVTFIVGIAAIFFSTSTKSSDYLSYLLAVGGLILVIVGLSCIFIQPNNIINQKSKQILHKQKMYFNTQDEKSIIHDICNGRLHSLEKKRCQSGQLLAIIYSSSNSHYYIVQLFKFVPFEYRPLSHPIIYNKA